MGLHLEFSFVSIKEEEGISEGEGDEDTECCEEVHMIRLVWAKADVAG